MFATILYILHSVFDFDYRVYLELDYDNDMMVPILNTVFNFSAPSQPVSVHAGECRMPNGTFVFQILVTLSKQNFQYQI